MFETNRFQGAYQDLAWEWKLPDLRPLRLRNRRPDMLEDKNISQLEYSSLVYLSTSIKINGSASIVLKFHHYK